MRGVKTGFCLHHFHKCRGRVAKRNVPKSAVLTQNQYAELSSANARSIFEHRREH